MIGHAWQLVLRCARCGFLIVVPEKRTCRALLDDTTELRMHAERVVTRDNLPCPRCTS